MDVIQTVDQAAGAAHRNHVSNIGAFITSIGTSLVVLTLGVLLFIIGRKRYLNVYQPRLLDKDEDARFPLPSKLVTCIKAIVRCDISIIHHSGLDAYLLLRFLAWMSLHFAICTLVACPILLPLNIAAGKRESAIGLDLLSLSPANGKAVYLTWQTAASILLSAQLGLLVHHEWHKALRLRDNDAWEVLHRSKYAVVVRYQIPQTQAAWRKIVRLYDHRTAQPRYYSQAYHCRVNAAKIQFKCARDRVETQTIQSMVSALKERKPFQQVVNEGEARSRNCLIRRFIGRPSRCLTQCVAELLTAESHLQYTAGKEEMRAEPTMVLNFDDPLSATIASLIQIPCEPATQSMSRDKLSFMSMVRTSLKSPKRAMPQVIRVRMDDILWGNIGSRRTWELWRMWQSRTILFALIGLWTVPIAFSGSLSQLGMISSYSPYLHWLDNVPPSWLSLAQASLPPMITTGLIALFQPVLSWFIATRRLASSSAEALATQRFHFAFLWVHLFLVTSIASGLTAAMVQILSNPNATLLLLAVNLPRASNFFLVFVPLRVFMEAGLVLARLWPWIKNALQGWRTITPREYQSRYIYQTTSYESNVSNHTILASIIIIYTPLVPIILPIGAIAFGILWAAYRYYFLSVAKVKAHYEGRQYLQMLSHVLFALETQQACSVGLLRIGQPDSPPVSWYINLALRITVQLITLVHHQRLCNILRVRTRTAVLPNGIVGKTDTLRQNTAPSTQTVDYNDLVSDAAIILPEDSHGIAQAAQNWLVEHELKVEISGSASLDDQGRLVARNASGTPV